MSLSSYFRRPLLLALPVAVMAFSSCGKKDEPAPQPVPDKGKVLVSHAAAASNTQLTAVLGGQQLGQLNYGQSTGYSSVNVGSPVLVINNGTQQAANPTLTIGKDQNYSAFIYSPSSNIGSTAVLTVTDDLSAPTTATAAKIRLVHLAVGTAGAVRLTVPSPTPGGAGTDLTTDVAFGTASPFVLLNAGPQNLSITNTDMSRTQLLVVGDGTGAGTGTKNYEAGKIYTIIVRGIVGSGVPTAQQPQAVIIQNN